MRALSLILTLTSLLLLSTSARAEGVFDPSNFELAGVWVAERPVRQGTLGPVATDDPRMNNAPFGHDELEFKYRTGYSSNDGLVTEYDGVWQHRRQLVQERTVDGSRVVTDPYCGIDEQKFEFDAIYTLTDEGVSLRMTAFEVVEGTGTLAYPINQITTELWRGATLGNNITLRYPATMFRQVLNNACGWATRDHALVRFQRSPRAPEVPTGKFSGVVRLNEPDGSAVSATVVPNGTMHLYRQKYRFDSQYDGESDVEYEARLEAHRDARSYVDAVPILDDGTFSFPSVPLTFARSVGYRRAFYTLEPHDAWVDLTVPDSDLTIVHVIPSGPTNLHGTNMEDLVVGVDGLDEIGTKKELVRRLSELGPVQWKTAEEGVDDYLDQLLDDTSAITDSNREGVRRAILAERVVYAGAVMARELIRTIFRGVGELAFLLIDEFGSTQRKKTGDRVKDANKAGSEMWNKLGDTEAARKFARLSKVKEVAIADGVKLGAYVANRYIWDPAIASAKNAEDRETYRALKLAFNGVLKSATTGETKGFVGTIVKLAIEKFGTTVAFDSAVPVSFTAISSPLLEASAANMQSWQQFDQPLFEQHRTDVFNTINRLNTWASWASYATEMQAEVGNAFGDAADIFELLALSRNPWFTAAEKASKLAKARLFLDSAKVGAVLAFGIIPDMMIDGVDQAWGVQRMQSPIVTAAPAAIAPALQDEASASATAYIAALTELDDALANDDVNAVLNSLDGLIAADGARSHWRSAALTLADGALAAPASEGEFEVFVAAVSDALFAETFAFDSASEAVLDHLHALHRGDFVDTNDILYLTRKDTVRRTLANLVAGIENAETSALDPLWEELSQTPVYPLLIAETVVDPVVLTTSGDQFLVRTTFRNTSPAALGPYTVSLEFGDAAFSTATATQQVTVAAAGMATLEWTVSTTDELVTVDGAAIDVLVQENGDEPTSAMIATRSTTVRVDPELLDADHDGLPDAWEADYGLDQTADDAWEDPDMDGLSNFRELVYGTLPNNADSDDDGLSDGEEVVGGDDGFKTDPLVADSDDDGTPDGEDIAPYDPADEVTDKLVEEPVLRVSTDTIYLNAENRRIELPIENAGEGALTWRSFAADPNILGLGPDRGDEDTPLVISTTLPDETLAELYLETAIVVRDISGLDSDATVIPVIIGDGTPTTGEADMGGDEADVGPASGDAAKDGCCRTTSSSSHAGPLLFLLFGGLLARRARR